MRGRGFNVHLYRLLTNGNNAQYISSIFFTNLRYPIVLTGELLKNIAIWQPQPPKKVKRSSVVKDRGPKRASRCEMGNANIWKGREREGAEQHKWVLLEKGGMVNGWMKDRYTVDAAKIILSFIHLISMPYLYVVQAHRISTHNLQFNYTISTHHLVFSCCLQFIQQTVQVQFW